MWGLVTPHKGKKYKRRFETNLFILQGKYQGAVAIVDIIDTDIEGRLKVNHKKTKATITRTTITNELPTQKQLFANDEWILV